LVESTTDQSATNLDMELAGDWAALPNSNAMEEISLAKKPLPSLHNQPAQVAEQLEVQLVKVVDRQILNSVVMVSVSQLL
jgi:hypothetical protein